MHWQMGCASPANGVTCARGSEWIASYRHNWTGGDTRWRLVGEGYAEGNVSFDVNWIIPSPYSIVPGLKALKGGS